MVINLKTSINNVVDEDNIFSFDISIFDYVIQSKIDINELNFSRILNGTTNILCISLYKYLNDKIKISKENDIVCHLYADDEQILEFSPNVVSYYIKTLDDGITQMEYVNILY